MVTQENIFFLRLVLLMIKVVTPVLKKILTRKICIQEDKAGIQDELNRFFQQQSEKIHSLKESGIIRKREYDAVFPECDLSKWDITLLSCILLELFEETLEASEKNAIIRLRGMKNDIQSHHTTGSIGVKEYYNNVNRIRTLITNLTLDFNRDERGDINTSIDSVINNEIDIQKAIEEIKKQSTTDELMDDVSQKIGLMFASVSELKVAVNDCQKDVSDLRSSYEGIKLSQEEIKKRLEELATGRNNDISTIIVGEVKISGKNPKSVMKAAEKLLADADVALNPAANVNEPKTGIKRCFDDIRDCGAEPKKVRLGSLIITIKCNSIQSVLNIMDYFQSQNIGQRMIEIAKDLTEEVGENISVTSSILLDSLRNAFYDIDTQVYTRSNTDSEPVYHRTVKVTTECHNAREVLHVWNVFEGGKTTNMWNELSEDLKDDNGSEISLSTSVETDGLKEYFSKANCTTFVDKDTSIEHNHATSNFENKGGSCDVPTDSLLRFYISRLESCAKPTETEKKYTQFVKYCNAFLSVFGKERIYLVGSTAEGINLKLSVNSGDADFLLCSGRVEIDLEDIEVLEELQGRVRVNARNLVQCCQDFIISGYLSSDILMDITPELFTFLRAICHSISRTTDITPGYEKRKTTNGVSTVAFKSGLARTEFRNLNLEDVTVTQGRSVKRTRLSRAQQQNKRWEGVQINMSDMKMLQKIANTIKGFKTLGCKEDCYAFFTSDLIDNIVQHIHLKQETGHGNDENEDFDDKAPDTSLESEHIRKNIKCHKIKATYSDLTSKDFIPALRIVGNRKITYLEKWRERVKRAKWPPRNTVEEIYNLDVVLVAGRTSMNPDACEDFRLSFNLAEVELCKSMTKVQRQVFLILKSYASGIMKRKFCEMGKEMEPKSYFLKTALFWVLEHESPTLWTDENIVVCDEAVLKFLLHCIRERRLPHYFMPYNLFAELDGEDCFILSCCIQEILKNPIDCIGEFNVSNQNRGIRGNIELTLEEISSSLEMNADRSNIQNLFKTEDTVIDLQRGFNEGPRDAYGRAPIKEALLKVVDVFFEEEKREKQVKNRTSQGDAAAGNLSQSAQIAHLLRDFLTRHVGQSMNSREANVRTDILALASLFPKGLEIINTLGGRDGVQNVLQQTTVQSVDHAKEIRDAIDNYLSCGDEEEACLELELKQKIAAYFIGAGIIASSSGQ